MAKKGQNEDKERGASGKKWAPWKSGKFELSEGLVVSAARKISCVHAMSRSALFVLRIGHVITMRAGAITLTRRCHAKPPLLYIQYAARAWLRVLHLRASASRHVAHSI